VARGIAWLYGELPALVEQGVLTPEAAEALRRHYGPPERAASAGRWAQVLLASFGALLVGGGIILILAHNWDELGRPARAALALGTLGVAQAVTFYAVWKRSASPPWTESVSAFLVAAVGAALAIIGQTYNLGGSFEDLLRTWLWLVIPIPYLTGSTLAAIGVWALLVVRSVGGVDVASRPPLDIWALILVAAPFVVARTRRAPHAWSTTLLTFAAAASTFAAGSVFAARLRIDGIWAVFQMSFVGAVLAVVTWPGRQDVPWRRRMVTPAWLVLIVLATILSFDAVWRGIDRFPSDVPAGHLIVTAAVVLTGVALAAVATLQHVHAGQWAASVGTGAALLVVVLYALSLGGAHDAGWIVFNAWLIAAGVLTLRDGMRRMEMGTANRGLAAVAAFVAARFFDTDLSFLVRGLGFVLLGLSCFGINWWLIRQGRRQTA
jgi:uncharacterized membrane protein